MSVNNPLIQAALSSARFAGRRACSRFSSTDPSIDTLIIDVDRTLTSEDSPKLALQRLVGREKTHEIFDSFLRDVVLGKMRIQDLHGAVFGELYSRGFRQSDWVGVMEDLDRSGGIKKRLIDLLLDLSGSHGLTLVLATRASAESARWLASRYGFHHAIGSVEKINGSFSGFETMIGSHDDGDRIVTKLTAASRAIEGAGRRMDPMRTAVISNDLLDALEMLGSARGVLILPEPPNTLEKLSAALRLYDVLVKERDVETMLPRALGLAS